MAGVRVGLGIALVNDRGEVLLTQRFHADNGPGEYAMPGGAMEPGETIAEGILRELREECGSELSLEDLRPLCVFHYTTAGGEDWIGIDYTAKLVSGHPERREPERHGEWEWYALDSLPSPMYQPSRWAVEALQTGEVWFGK